jgi:Asp/Glu/hydantoin racemase
MPRVMLIHAVSEAIAPVREAFSERWPQCEIHNLLDSSLSADLAAVGGVLGEGMVQRFKLLARYAAAPAEGERRADGILFTCSAFGPAIEAARREVAIPVLKPNEAAFEEALAHGPRIGLIVTFEPSLAPMLAELRAMMRAASTQAASTQAGMGQAGGDGIRGVVVPGAFAALRAGRQEEHDRRIAECVGSLPPLDAIVLGQFSMASAAPPARQATSTPVLTTPGSAVDRLRHLLEHR